MGDELLNRAPFLLGDDFSFAECICAPWVQRFFVTLPYFRGIDFDHRIIDLKAKPAEFVEKYKRVGSGTAMVPLLEHGQELVIESTVVARYIAEYVGGPELYPRT